MVAYFTLVPLLFLAISISIFNIFEYYFTLVLRNRTYTNPLDILIEQPRYDFLEAFFLEHSKTLLVMIDEILEHCLKA